MAYRRGGINMEYNFVKPVDEPYGNLDSGQNAIIQYGTYSAIHTFLTYHTLYKEVIVHQQKELSFLQP